MGTHQQTKIVIVQYRLVGNRGSMIQKVWTKTSEPDIFEYSTLIQMNTNEFESLFSSIWLVIIITDARPSKGYQILLCCSEI